MTDYLKKSFSVYGGKSPKVCDHKAPLDIKGRCLKCGEKPKKTIDPKDEAA